MPQFIYDIIPPGIKKGITVATQEVSKWIKFLRMFLKTSKYGTLILIVVLIGFGAVLVFAFSPGEKIEIFPTQYRVENWSEEPASESYEIKWQNREKALQRELGEEASLAEFSSENSAILFEEIEELSSPLEILVEESEEIVSSESIEEVLSTESEQLSAQGGPASGWEEVVSESVGVEQLVSESEVIEEIIDIEEVAGTATESDPEGSLPHPPGLQPETDEERSSGAGELVEERVVEVATESEVIEESIKETLSEGEDMLEGVGGCEFCEGEELASDAEDLLNLMEEVEETASISQPPLTSYSIIFSGFEYTTSESFNSFKKAKLMLSWANKERQGKDVLLVEYKINNNQTVSEAWETLGITQLDKEHSNLLDKGYWAKEISDINSWMTLKDLEIKITIQSFNAEDRSPIFIDAVWISMEKVSLDEDRDLKKTHNLENISEKKSFKKGDDLEFKFDFKRTENERILGLFSSSKNVNVKGISIKATVADNNGQVLEEINSLIDYGEDGQFTVTIDKSDFYKLRPGKYKLKIEIENEEGAFFEERDFTWGVLAINTNKSIYLPGEKIYLQMAALGDDGHTICDANLKLEIISPDANVSSPTVQRSGKCGRNNVTDVPDYFAYYQVEGAGIYQMKLTNLDNGYEINDSFEVKNYVPFEIERIGPTRIYPPTIYEMVIKIKINQDFEGRIIETIPNDFETKYEELRIKKKEWDDFVVFEQGFLIEENSNKKQLIWQNIPLKQGDEIELRYMFDAPDISPYLYLLGPLEFYEQR